MVAQQRGANGVDETVDNGVVLDRSSFQATYSTVACRQGAANRHSGMFALSDHATIQHCGLMRVPV